MQARELQLRLKGKEKASFLYRETRTYRDGDGETRSETITRKEKMVRKLLEFNAVVFTFQFPLDPGDFVINFSFQLPMGLPASIMF